ncbi:replication/maintenance protein RepL, partial [Priestia megaterium]|uniref:replication/maintenance protein RepL n=4 Tax=cellular organisms TaxID=131567 RepID=UPI00064C67BB
RMSYGNQLVLNAALKRQIAEEIDLSVSSINNAITKFVKGELLERIDTGLYRVNPHLFGKGEWKDIAKIRLEVAFDSEGKTIMSEIERKEID